MSHLCIYHKDCADGFGAALAVKHYCDLNDFHCDFLPANHGDIAPDVSNKQVLIVDFTYPRDVIVKMNQGADSLLIIDHHKTAQEALEGLDFCVFDMSKSGAVLSWEHLMPDLEVPALLKYIQDRDLWHWQLPNSKEISAALQTMPKEFELWQPYLNEANLFELVNKGTAIVEYQNQQIQKVVQAKDIPIVEIAGYKVPCINTTQLASEIGNALAKGYPFAALYADTATQRVFSLRSDENGIDVSKIARLFGGGGHFHAAGFAVDKPEVALTIKN